jgi:hypothetical protein
LAFEVAQRPESESVPIVRVPGLVQAGDGRGLEVADADVVAERHHGIELALEGLVIDDLVDRRT